MTTRKFHLPALVAAGCVSVLAASSLAWACSPQARIIVNPPFGPPGATSQPGQPTVTPVTVTGASVPAGAPVHIRWNATDGADIGAATADAKGNFSAVVAIPQAPADIYYIVAVVGTVGTARAAFEVTPAAVAGGGRAAGVEPGSAHGVSADLWKGFGSESGRAGTNVVVSAVHSPTSPVRAAGTLLLGMGLVSLLAGIGVGVMGARRRRAVKPPASGA